MAKYKVITNHDQVAVRQKLSSGESINSGETAFLSRVYIKGLMRPTVEDSKKLLHINAAGIPLIKFIRRRVNKAQFFMIVAQIIEAVKKTSANGLRLSNLVLDTDFVIINDRTGDLFFVYQPVNGARSNMGLIPFIREIVSSSGFDPSEDVSYVNNFVGYLNSLTSFSMPDFENYIYSVSPQTYGIMQRMGYLSPTAPVQQSLVQTSVQPRQQTQPSSFARPTQPSAPAQNQSAPSDNSPVVQPQTDTAAADNTIAEKIINDINAGSAKLKPSDPKLKRRTNGETIGIVTIPFKIGKDQSRTDYCVTDNKTVSRLHASITVKDGEYFITDNNSTNRTFINGSPIPAQTETRLKSGDVIKLSNEEFVFTV